VPSFFAAAIKLFKSVCAEAPEKEVANTAATRLDIKSFFMKFSG
jgi:hypothetical protein